MKNKVMLVTGASRGIGADISFHAANAGYFVIINYILPHCRSPPLYKSSIQKTYKMEEI